MGTAQLVFAKVVRGGATGSHVTGSDVSHEYGSDVIHKTGSGPDQKSRDRKRPLPEVCSEHAQRKLRNIRPSRAFSPEVTSSNVT